MTEAAADLVSPLQEIERAVLEEAKRIALDMTASDGATHLRLLIDQEIARWHEDYQRGQRTFDISDTELLAGRALRNLTGYGPLQPLLDDPDVWEIMINGPDAVRG